MIEIWAGFIFYVLIRYRTKSLLCSAAYFLLQIPFSGVELDLCEILAAHFVWISMQRIVVIHSIDELVTFWREERLHLLTLVGASRWFIDGFLQRGLSILSVEIVQLWYMITHWTYHMEIPRVLIHILWSYLQRSSLQIKVLLIIGQSLNISNRLYISTNNLALILCLPMQSISWILACNWCHVLTLRAHLIRAG